MAKTTIDGWSPEKHSEFVEYLRKYPWKRLKLQVKPIEKSLLEQLEEALGYREWIVNPNLMTE